MVDKLIFLSKIKNHTITRNLVPCGFEDGANSRIRTGDLFLTNNLIWTIENFAKEGRGYLTFPTKFDMIKPLLVLDHKGKTIIRMSVNPDEIIKQVEFGTSSLKNRIKAINNLCEAGYPVGLLIAPIIMLENWKTSYSELLDVLKDSLSEKVKNSMLIEIIFMTYSYIHKMINAEAFPNAINLFNKEQMTGRGRGKYHYKKDLKEDGKNFIKNEVLKRFPNTKIAYIV